MPQTNEKKIINNITESIKVWCDLNDTLEAISTALGILE